MSDKKTDILGKAEDIILKKLEYYESHAQEMNDKDCYALQLLVITEGRIQAIKNGGNNQMPF